MEQHRRQHRTANRGQLRQAKDRRGSSLELFAGGAEEPLRDTESVARAATAEGGLFLLVRPDGIDRQALEAIYLCMGGEQWTNARGWTVTDDLSKWHGVTLGADGTVVELDLGANNVTGRQGFASRRGRGQMAAAAQHL